MREWVSAFMSLLWGKKKKVVKPITDIFGVIFIYEESSLYLWQVTNRSWIFLTHNSVENMIRTLKIDSYYTGHEILLFNDKKAYAYLAMCDDLCL